VLGIGCWVLAVGWLRGPDDDECSHFIVWVKYREDGEGYLCSETGELGSEKGGGPGGRIAG
jgi:hypothetical protein